MNWQWNGGGGHAMTVRGYDSSSNVYYIDPWLSGGGYKVKIYNACVYESGTNGHSWVTAFIIFTID